MDGIILSIIVPVYNVEKYIDRCLESLLSQIDKNVELIIVNDNTKDASMDICREKTKGMPNVILIDRDKNGGLSAARNTGIINAGGKYLWFVDSDDYVEESSVEIIIKKIEETKADFYMFNHSRISEGIVVSKSRCTSGNYIIDSNNDRLMVSCDYIANKMHGFEVWSKVYSKKIVDNYNLLFEPNKDIFAEDICFNLYFLQHCRTVVKMENFLYVYCIRSDSIMGCNINAKLYEMNELAYRVYLSQTDLYVKKNFHLIYSAIMRIHELYATEYEMESFCKNPNNIEFAVEMCKNTIKNLKKHIKIYGKRNGLLHYIYSQRFISNVFDKKIGIVIWKKMSYIIKDWRNKKLC